MSKAILVLDEFYKDCIHCKLGVDIGGKSYCGAAGYKEVLLGDMPKPDWCQLKEMPDYERGHVSDEDLIYLPSNFKHSVSFALGHESGWNDCLDAIKGD